MLGKDSSAFQLSLSRWDLESTDHHPADSTDYIPPQKGKERPNWGEAVATKQQVLN